MAFTPNIKASLSTETPYHEFLESENTGSSEYQIASLSKEIERLTQHFRVYKKDKHSRRGLFAKVGQRHRLLLYLKRSSEARYYNLIKKLGLRDKA